MFNNRLYIHMAISTIAAAVFLLGYGFNHFVGNGLLALVVAIAAIVWGIALLLGK